MLDFLAEKAFTAEIFRIINTLLNFLEPIGNSTESGLDLMFFPIFFLHSQFFLPILLQRNLIYRFYCNET